MANCKQMEIILYELSCSANNYHPTMTSDDNCWARMGLIYSVNLLRAKRHLHRCRKCAFVFCFMKVYSSILHCSSQSRLSYPFIKCEMMRFHLLANPVTGKVSGRNAYVMAYSISVQSYQSNQKKQAKAINITIIFKFYLCIFKVTLFRSTIWLSVKEKDQDPLFIDFFLQRHHALTVKQWTLQCLQSTQTALLRLHNAHGNSQVKPLYNQVCHYKQGMLNLGQLNIMLCEYAFVYVHYDWQ